MTPMGQACQVCRERPAIRIDGLCAKCGETHDIAVRLIEAWADKERDTLRHMLGEQR